MAVGVLLGTIYLFEYSVFGRIMLIETLYGH